MSTELNPILDSREPKNVQELFHEFYPTGTIKMLDSGDLICDERSFAVERKTITDLVGSVLGNEEQEGRIWEQAYNLSQNYENAYLIIIGDYDNLPRPDQDRFSREMYHGVLASLRARYKLNVFNVASNREFFTESKRLLSKCDGDLKLDRIMRFSKVHKKDNYMPIHCLIGVEGIGVKQATAIVESLNIHHARELSDLSMDQLLSVSGIGKTRATKIKEEF